MDNPGQQIRLRSSARTNTGMVRDNNEDSVHLWTHNDHVVLAIVADGMGGAVAGEEASSIAINTIQNGLMEANLENLNSYDESVRQEIIDYLKDSINSANASIVDRAKAQPELKGMGTTVTLALVQDTRVVIGHVGDSRAYVISGLDGHIRQVTSDHSFVQALISAGHISEEEAEEHPMKNVLYRALGQANDLEIDVYHETLHVGDRLVLCSDGLTLHVKPREIAECALAESDPARISQKLIDLTNNRGGRDNVSVIVIAVEQAGDSEVGLEAIHTEEKHEQYSSDDTQPLQPGIDSSESFSPSGTEPLENRTPPEDSTAGDLVVNGVPKITSDDEDTDPFLGEGRDISTPDQ
jgi:PPM family protein phosphatase